MSHLSHTYHSLLSEAKYFRSQYFYALMAIIGKYSRGNENYKFPYWELAVPLLGTSLRQVARFWDFGGLFGRKNSHFLSEIRNFYCTFADVMKIVIIGSGNLATQLSLALSEAGQQILQVYSRTEANASLLAQKLGCPYTTSIEELTLQADMYIISVKDDAIAGLAEQVGRRAQNAIVVHTAGSIAMEVLKPHAQHYGVLYPMQTFSKNKRVDFNLIPCFLEASDEETLSAIRKIAESISENVVLADSEKRKKIHLAAVLACNFTNHCYRLAEKVLSEEQIDFKLFLPLIDETARKVAILSPKQAQTGPMMRWDTGVMQMQMGLLNDERTRQIYQLMAESIHEDATSADDTCHQQKP